MKTKRFFRTMGIVTSMSISAIISIQCSAEANAVDTQATGYQVYLPSDYDSSRKYPSVYLMPMDGYSSQVYYNDGIEQTLEELMSSESVTDLIVVFPEFSLDTDYKERLNQIISEVDANYSTIPCREKRGILGVGVGGYMAYDAALNGVTKDKFYAVGSHMGIFTGDENPWYLEENDIAKLATKLSGSSGEGYEVLKQYYFYIDGPNGSPRTTLTGETSTIGSELEKTSNPYWQYGGMYYLAATPDLNLVEYAVLDGEEDADYYQKYMSRSLQRFSHKFIGTLVQGELSCQPQAVKATDQDILAEISVDVSELLATYAENKDEITVTLSLYDTETGEKCSSYSQTLDGNTLSFTLKQDNLSPDNNTYVVAEANLLGFTEPLAETTLVRIKEATDTAIDLMGDWYFQAYKNYSPRSTTTEELDKVTSITKETFESWETVQPCLGWWTDDFAKSLNGQANYEGYAWYVREFDVPENFAKENLILSAGKFDEANEVFVNGQLVGSTGMDYSSADGIGVYDGTNPWDTDCVYELNPDFLNYGETNVIAIRMCNSTGGGGWYEGAVSICTKDELDSAGDTEKLLLSGTYASASTGEIESYRIYLPTDYQSETEKSYPVLYLLHGINSSSKTFEIDGISRLLNQAILEGELEDIIVVMPDDPTKESFWAGKYGTMVTEDLIAHIDSEYRTLSDKEHRYIAGCSMGGAGSVALGLKNPDKFSGIISFYGAIEYVNGFKIADAMDKETLDGYKIYMVCGNEDMYNFYNSQEQLSGLLTAKGVEHYHLVDCGGHTSSFYLPHFLEAIQYVTNR